MDNKYNITSTGIAVALAVIIALALLFFGPEIFTFITRTPGGSLTATPSAASSTADNTMDNGSTTPPAIPADVTELTTKDVTVGTGATAQAGDTVTVQYVGMLTDGTVFDASKNHGDQGFTFQLGAGQVIKGWDEGVAGMKVGGTRELVIPASLGYGAQAVGPIPANSTLVFQVELVNVQSGS